MNRQYLLKDITMHLTAVADGREAAEMVIKNGNLVNVNTGELLENMDVAIARGRIALVGDATHTIGKNTKVVDATGYYITPGFMDGHIHVESSMMTVKGYSRAVIPCGTTAIFADPHEVANVFGAEGVSFMLNDGKDIPLKLFICMPSCVPAVSFFEDTGGIITVEDIKEFLEIDEVCGLGEVMNVPGVIEGDEKIHQELHATLVKNKIITGHYATLETGKGLNAYIASGARCCHESVRKEDALAKMRLGMYAQLREGSAWRDLKEVVKAVTETNIDTRYVNLISDDVHPDTLINYGHLNHIVRRAIEEGVNPIKAIQMVTINVAQCFQMDRDLGSVSPGKCADILLLSDLARVAVDKVIINGELVAEKGKLTVEIKNTPAPDWMKNSVHLLNPLAKEDFKIEAPKNAEKYVNTRFIEIIEAKVGTYNRQQELEVVNGLVMGNVDLDIIKVVVIERHKNTGSMGKGFVKGFNLKYGAVASTVAHDAHNLIIIGTNDSDMAFAGNTLKESGGGMVVVKDGKILALLPLALAGLMCEEDAESVAESISKLGDAWKELGCYMVSPFMTMALISLVVLPELRLTNRGLVDTVEYKFTDMFPGE